VHLCLQPPLSHRLPSLVPPARQLTIDSSKVSHGQVCHSASFALKSVVHDVSHALEYLLFVLRWCNPDDTFNPV
jgi:hypothetical protein